MPTEEARMRELTRNAGELAKRIDELHQSVDAQTAEIAAQNKRNSIKIRWIAVAVVLLAAVSVMVAIGYVRQRVTSARLEGAIRQQEVIRSQVLCPWFRLVLGSYQPETRAPGPDRDKYEVAFADMRTQYAALDCVGDFVPPRSDLVTKPPR